MARSDQKDLGGMRFGRWLVHTEEESPTIVHTRPGGGKTRKWNCVCDCGTVRYVDGDVLRNGRSSSCGCLHKEILGSKATQESSFNKVLAQYKRGARNRKLSFTLTKESFSNLIKSDCYYCGVPPSNKLQSSSQKSELWYNGIDRKDNNKGYEEGNVVSCCKICNHAKHTMDENLFLSWIDRLVNYRKGT